MDRLASLLPLAHPVDHEVLPLLGHAVLKVPALRVMYGARYWPRVKAAVLATNTPDLDFADRVIAAAAAATRTARVDADLLIGITAAAIDLYDRLGRDAFASTPDPELPPAAALETPTMVLRRRNSNAPEGFLGRCRGDARRWRVTLEPDPSSQYTVGHGDRLAPCRGGNHEHCDVGIVAGADRVSPCEGPEPYPRIRRACQTSVFGRVSLLTAAL